MPDEFVHPLRVRFAECDPQGVVFNAHYLAYFDLAMTELWRERCGGYQEMVSGGIDIVVAEARARFLAPARFDDELGLGVAITRLGRTSLVTAHTIRRAGETCVEGELRHVFVDTKAERPTPIPDAIRAALAPLQT